MIKEKIIELIMEIPERFKGISKAHYEYYKAATYEQFVIIISGISILSILFLFACLFLVFFTFGIAFYLGFILGNYAWGFLILAAFYLLLGVLIYKKRGPWIVNPVVKILELIFYSDQGIFDKLIKKHKKDEEAQK
jgi:hypothetical protein